MSSLIRLDKSFFTCNPYNDNMLFGTRLKELREIQGISQMELARKTGLSQSAIAKWELNKTEPSASAIITLAKFFNETTDYILGVTN